MLQKPIYKCYKRNMIKSVHMELDIKKNTKICIRDIYIYIYIYIYILYIYIYIYIIYITYS